MVQYLTFSNVCRACRQPLGFEYAMIPFNARTLRFATPQNYLSHQFGQVLRALRLQKRLTRNQLAILTGMHVSYLSRLERGRIVPNLSTIAPMLRSMEIDRIILRVWPGR
jgi:ribosome-binding protein aMBF1 (putative translation factor)